MVNFTDSVLMPNSTNGNFSTASIIDNFCQYGYDIVPGLASRTYNISAEDALAWPCELRTYLNELEIFKNLVNILLSYGTSIVVLFGIVLNLLSLRVLVSPRLMGHSPYLYLLVLSLYDALVLIFNFGVGVLRGQSPATVNVWFQSNEWLCIVHSVMVELFNLLSIWTIVCLTVERLIVVFFPLKASLFCSLKNTKYVITAMSIIILLFSCHKILVTGFEGDSVFGYKACLTHRKKAPEAIYFYVAFNTWLPTICILTINIMISIKIRKVNAFRREISSGNSRLIKKEMKVTKTMTMLCFFYLLLVLPLGILQSIELWWNSSHNVNPSAMDPRQQQSYIDYQKTKIILKLIRSLAFFFYQLNFAMNFFIYLLSNTKFRFHMVALMPCFNVRRKPGSLSSVQYRSSYSSATEMKSIEKINDSRPTLSTIDSATIAN